jgi:LacI family transcriptional regulator
MKRTFSLGFIGPELGNPVRHQRIAELRQRALEKGFQLLVSGVNHGEDIGQALGNMISRRVDALILGNVRASAHVQLRELHEKHFPLVEFGQDTGANWDRVSIDYARMTRDLTRHLLIEHGLKRLVFAGSSHAYSRHEAYQTVMREAGLMEHLGLWGTNDHSLEGGRHLAQTRIRAGERPEGIVCHNDLLALGIIAGLRRCGLRVPEDIAVVGLDDIEFASYTQPTLTTAGVDSSQLASALLELLLARLQGDPVGEPRRIDCPSQVFIRESCGCHY